VSLAKEAGATIRVAITEWPQTLRLISLLAAMTGPLALIVVLVILLRSWTCRVSSDTEKDTAR
jgi:hypothetical protein